LPPSTEDKREKPMFIEVKGSLINLNLIARAYRWKDSKGNYCITLCGTLDEDSSINQTVFEYETRKLRDTDFSNICKKATA
jgi:hypothetical protein